MSGTVTLGFQIQRPAPLPPLHLPLSAITAATYIIFFLPPSAPRPCRFPTHHHHPHHHISISKLYQPLTVCRRGFYLRIRIDLIGHENFESLRRIRKERSSEVLIAHRERERDRTVPMPSVEMRRTTRVFGARVLRSGRRLFPTDEKLKHMRRTNLAVENAEEDWIELLDHDDGDVEFKDNGWHNSHEANNDELMDIEGETQTEIKLGELRLDDSFHQIHHNSGCRRWGLVYSRKRKRNLPSTDHDTQVSSDKRYGKKFVRKQARKTIIADELLTDFQTLPPKIIIKRNQSPVKRLPLRSKSKRKKVPTGMNTSNLPPRNNITIHRAIQKRRSSFRSRKRRNPSSCLVKDGVPFFPIKSNPEISQSICRPNFKELKSTLVELTQNIDSATCSANILVIESDRCYRESGAVITMEMAAPKQWFLVVKRNGVESFRVETRTAMRSCFHNRVTHAIIWAGNDESWRLEFPNRQDWFVFKELYRKCSERSVQLQATLTSIIPVPRVNEVKGYADVESSPFIMPDSYITSRGDEVSRVLERSDTVYDMDSDDDEWLKKFNFDRDVKVNEDDFEKIIDSFERGIYGSPEDYADVALVVDRCQMLASKDVLEGVYDYWMAKRKKKHSALIRVFQFYKPKKTEQLNTKSVLRKKRSFRKRGNQSGRGKQLTFLKAALYDKNVEEAENTALKVEETEGAAKRAEEGAIVKRERAQMLMEVADLLTYKATMALRVAEALATYGSVELGDMI
ncbi:uncharacterized protein LOC111914017 isoform X1 [Lactuca sativa]|uniref:Enhancer of polycomb-like protein n=1 Tax=Lactuca sativa TaxID=4236 RepID=A0A9R1UGN4_LACSA|nr:uncharacterized protein LOC111914017 isoform X1 [Lactuca sativa]KAJ0186690.1 hypothetical protein LSAT_V11C900474760 [Lactuca sativa]